MKIVVKGMNYTEIRTSRSKDPTTETIQHWVLAKLRKPEDCGVWVDGKQTANYDTMGKSPLVNRKAIGE
jgi:hypothetical protein